jgi:hypothetical protein
MDLEGSCRRGIIGGFRARRKGGFAGLGGYNLLFFLGTLGIFQPSLGVCHENMDTNFIFEATNKAFLKKEYGMPSVLKPK